MQATSLAVAGAFALVLAGTAAAAPLSVSGKAAVTDQTSVAQQLDIQPIVYHHHYRSHYHHYGYNPGPAIAGTALGLIGGAIAGAEGYGPYGYGYGYGPWLWVRPRLLRRVVIV